MPMLIFFQGLWRILSGEFLEHLRTSQMGESWIYTLSHLRSRCVHWEDLKDSVLLNLGKTFEWSMYQESWTSVSCFFQVQTLTWWRHVHETQSNRKCGKTRKKVMESYWTNILFQPLKGDLGSIPQGSLCKSRDAWFLHQGKCSRIIVFGHFLLANFWREDDTHPHGQCFTVLWSCMQLVWGSEGSL